MKAFSEHMQIGWMDGSNVNYIWGKINKFKTFRTQLIMG